MITKNLRENFLLLQKEWPSVAGMSLTSIKLSQNRFKLERDYFQEDLIINFVLAISSLKFKVIL